jgi:hypothetical protein
MSNSGVNIRDARQCRICKDLDIIEGGPLSYPSSLDGSFALCGASIQIGKTYHIVCKKCCYKAGVGIAILGAIVYGVCARINKLKSQNRSIYTL